MLVKNYRIWYKPINNFAAMHLYKCWNFTFNNCNKEIKIFLNKIQFKMLYICRFCKRTFSTRTGLSQHVKYCIDEIEESSLISEINEMSLESEEFFPNIEEVRVKELINSLI